MLSNNQKIKIEKSKHIYMSALIVVPIFKGITSFYHLKTKERARKPHMHSFEMVLIFSSIQHSSLQARMRHSPSISTCSKSQTQSSFIHHSVETSQDVDGESIASHECISPFITKSDVTLCYLLNKLIKCILYL